MLKKIINLLKSFFKYSLTKKSYWLPGCMVMGILFIVTNILNFSFSYMGNTSDEVTAFVIKNFWVMILLQVFKIIFLYLVIGIFLNILYLKVLQFIDNKWNFSLKNKTKQLITVLFIFITINLYFFKTLIIFPQLFIENFAKHADFLTRFQYFMTDTFSPVFFNILLIIINLPFILTGSFLIVQKIILKIKKFQLKEKYILLYKYRYIFSVLLVGLIVLTLILNSTLFSNSRINKKNILIISSDAVCPDHLSANGYKRNTTPNIDKLIKKSAQFRNVFTTVPRTLPSWVSMLTSQTPLTHDIKHMFPRTRERSEKIHTAADYLAKNGYSTTIISDFAGDIFPRIDLGFGKTIAPNMNFDILIKQVILERQIFLLPFITGKTGQKIFPELRGIAKYANPEIITDELLNEIDNAEGKPFFITAFYSITHFPFSAPYPYYKKYADKTYKGPFKYLKQIILKIGKGNKDEDLEGFKELPEKDKQQISNLYDGCLNLFDREFGKIINYLKNKNILKNTIILVYSDHGENLYDYDFGLGHGEHLKGNAALEIPCIIFADKLQEYAGKTYHRAGSQIDIMPTIFEMAHINQPSSFRGKSLFTKKRDSLVDAYLETGIWFDNNQQTNLFFQKNRILYPDISGLSEVDTLYNNEIVIKQYFQNIVNGAKYRAIYSGKYKLIYMPEQDKIKYELYDNIKDPHNKNNLALKKPRILKLMRKKLFDYVIDESAGNFIEKNGYLLPVFSDPVF